MSQTNRVETMALKLMAYAQRAGVEPNPLLQAYRTAIEIRTPVLRDIFHRELLHPARTALILLDDACCRNATLLAAAALVETEHPALRVPASRARTDVGDRAAALMSAVPIPAEAGAALVEQLVTAEEDVALIAVAERLDHARHLHFRERAVWRPFYDEIINVYLPFSQRVNQAMATRLERWAGAFGQRLAV